MVCLTEERRLALFPAGTIVRDPHHCESPKCREQDLNLRRVQTNKKECSNVTSNQSVNLKFHVINRQLNMFTKYDVTV